MLLFYHFLTFQISFQLHWHHEWDIQWDLFKSRNQLQRRFVLLDSGRYRNFDHRLDWSLWKLLFNGSIFTTKSPSDISSLAALTLRLWFGKPCFCCPIFEMSCCASSPSSLAMAKPKKWQKVGTKLQKFISWYWL